MREDSAPWYRQFWPWFLIVLPGSVVVAAFVTLYIAHRHADDLVVDEYYKDGLAINRQLAKQDTARQRGYSARLIVSDDRIEVDTGGVKGLAGLRLRLSHPLEADRDFTVQLRRTGETRYAAALPAPVASNWHWILDAGEDGSWRLDGSLARGDFRGDNGG
ncbi:CcoH-like protein [Pseudohaliea rubra DSM 19751]|uniref:CcoH-like protein n=1 Tax=Pseudohaliea rubra DSM 19751 TaxID=1265313 RepID=A0A095VPD5_9GAMM|nr:CcoH-like protein [Pseudohaliea rubra DSM 19751]